MKKIMLMLSLSGLLVVGLNSCNSKPAAAPEATTTPAEPVAAQPVAAEPVKAAEVVSSIAVPTFADAGVTKFCDDYKVLMTEYSALKGTGDKAKAAELATKFGTWAKGAGALAGKIKPDEMKKFNDFIMEAQTKFKEMSTAVAK